MPSKNPHSQPKAEVLVEVLRGALVESRHRGHLVAALPDGKVVASLGTPGAVFFMRSAGKPFQAIPLVSAGAADHYNFTEKELALACGSHHGELEHVETAAGMLKKAGLDARALKCGLHRPFSAEAAELLSEGTEPRVLQNNCSGKHAGMLALSMHLKAPTGTYDQPHHPVQRLILEAISAFAGLQEKKIGLAVDGCGVPVFALPLASMALMAARLVSPPPGFDAAFTAAAQRLTSAMTAYPEMVGGHFQSLDTDLMKWSSGALVSKSGAEGLYLAGIKPCARWPQGLGLAFKVEDGDKGNRARGPAAVEALRQCGQLEKVGLRVLAKTLHPSVRNNRGEKVGLVRPAFRVKWRV